MKRSTRSSTSAATIPPTRRGRSRRQPRLAGLELRVVGVPKTVDNDLPATDHCPGYGSAARFVAQVTRETALDTIAMRTTDPIRLIEVMGRDAGWLAGRGVARQRAAGRRAAPRLPTGAAAGDRTDRG